MNRFCRAMFGTRTAVGFLHFYNTVIFNKFSFTYLNQLFFFFQDGKYCSSRTYITADSTIEIAVPVSEPILDLVVQAAAGLFGFFTRLLLIEAPRDFDETSLTMACISSSSSPIINRRLFLDPNLQEIPRISMKDVPNN